VDAPIVVAGGRRQLGCERAVDAGPQPERRLSLVPLRPKVVAVRHEHHPPRRLFSGAEPTSGGVWQGSHEPAAVVISPSSLARLAASARDLQSSLARMLRTCVSTVRGLRNRTRAISLSVWPSATRRTTSSSRRVSPACSDWCAARRPRRR